MIGWTAVLLTASQPMSAIAAQAPAEQARSALNAQAQAWNRGDLNSALAVYCDTPAMTWVNRAGVTRGFADFAEAMRRDFAGGAAMGTMRFDLLDARSVSGNAAVTVIRWSVERNGRRVMGGVSTQFWQICGRSLRVVLEHAS